MARAKPPLGAELRADHPLAQNLVGFWLFNEGGGTGFTDLTGHNHGTYTGSSGTDFADWGTDEGLNFGSDGGGASAGGNHRISLGTVTADNPLSLAGNTACTFIFRANYGSSAGSNDFPRLASKGDGGNGANGWTLYGGNNGARTMGWTCDGQTTTLTPAIFADNDTFYTIAVVRNGANLRWFRDGVFFSSNSVTANAPPAASAEGTILNWHSTNREWAGRIEFLGIWARAMTDAEVAQYCDDPYQHVSPRRREIGPMLALMGAGGGDLNISATTDAYAWTEQAATVATSRDVAATTDAYAWTANNAAVTFGLTVEATTQAYGWTAQAATIVASLDVSATTATYGWTANNATIAFGLNVEATTDAYAWTAQAASVSTDRDIAATTQSYGWTAQVATVQAGNSLNLNATTATYGWTTQAATIVTSREVSAAVASYAWVGNVATVTFGDAPSVAVGAGSGYRKRRRIVLGGKVFAPKSDAEEERLVAEYVESLQAETVEFSMDDEPGKARGKKVSLAKATAKLDTMRTERRRRNDEQLIAILAA